MGGIRRLRRAWSEAVPAQAEPTMVRVPRWACGHQRSLKMNASWLFVLGGIAGACAGLLAGFIGIGGGIVVVPVIYYGLVMGGTVPDQAAHVAVATSLAAILPTAIVSSIG